MSVSYPFPSPLGNSFPCLPTFAIEPVYSIWLWTMQMRVYRSCSHPVAAMILEMYVDNNGIRYNWSWCKNLRSLSSKMVALICNVKESSIGILSVRYTYDKITEVIGCNQQAYIDRLLVKYGMKMLMLASCRWIQAPTLNRFPSLTRLTKSLCVLMRASVYSYQHCASAQVLHEQSYSVHIQGNAGTSHLR